jgi:flagellar hook-associated protein 3 FlgL
MSNGISSIGNFISSVSLMTSAETHLQTLNEQNSTGLKSQSLAGYGTSASQILNLQSEVTETQGWIENSKTVATTLSAYNTTLGQLTADATQLQTALQSYASGSTGSTTSADIASLIKGLESDVSATLNTQVGDTYIYAGTRYGTAPVVDLSTLTTPTTPSAFTLASGTTNPPTIPDYDSAYASTNPPGQVTSASPYYGSVQSNISDTQTLSYGITSNNDAMQQLVYALQQAAGGAAATNSTTASSFMSNALSAVNSAISGLNDLTQQNATNQNTVTTEQDAQNQAVSTLQTQLSDLTQVDPATVATELTQLENQLQGTYKATASLLNLSLLNYL